MSKPYQDLLRSIIQQRQATARPVRAPASFQDIEHLKSDVRRLFDAELPMEYLEFLSLSDGLQHNGLIVYDTTSTPEKPAYKGFWQGFIAANQLWRENPDNSDYLIFGDDDMDLLTFNLKQREFQQVDRAAYDSYESYPTFDAMLVAALERVAPTND